MTPTDHTSTLEDIFGGFFPTTKHSGGKYLNQIKIIGTSEYKKMCP